MNGITTHILNGNKRPTVVISAVNITEGGPLSILQDAVNFFLTNYASYYNTVLLVHNKKLFEHIHKNTGLKIITYSYSKRSWLLRAWFEYVHSYFISRKLKPFLWISLHDMTPNVACDNQIVYCHNPAPFYRLSFKEAKIERTLMFFNMFYSLFYKINIRLNKYVIVQQQWLRDEFVRRYKINNVVVAHPDVEKPAGLPTARAADKKFRFIYPALPRVFKNFEILFEASIRLERECNDFEVMVTIDGSENMYASKLVKKYCHLQYIKFIGLQKRETMWQIYNNCSCLVFPSRLETWGMPITEMKLYNKPMIIADCKYAYETVGNYGKACFFNADNVFQLTSLMKQAINNTMPFHVTGTHVPAQPYASNWKELFSVILRDHPGKIPARGLTA